MGRGHSNPAPVVEDGHMVDGTMGDIHVIEDAIGRSLSRWGQHMEAGVAGEREFDGGGAQDRPTTS